MTRDPLPNRARVPTRLARFDLIILILILLIAAGLRFAALADIPPGLFNDEAVNGLDAVRMLQTQRYPLFFESNGGREPLFIYLQALSLSIFGPSAWALRLVSALIGTLTVAALFLLVREITHPRAVATSFALVASAGLATSYWHLHYSRFGLRAILLPFIACLALYFYVRARRMHRTRDVLWAGFFLGVSFYSYLAARLLPLVFVGLLLFDLRQKRVTVTHTALLIAVAAITAAPLALYFTLFPAAFLGRAGDVAITGSLAPLELLVENTLRVAGMFFVRGDVEWRHGLSLQPVLDPFSAGLFVLGLLASLWYRRNTAAGLMWLWLVVMLLPTILSIQAPDTLRAIGAVTTVYWFVALGWSMIGEWASKRVRWHPRAWTLLGVAGLLVISGLFTFRDYFIRWANDPHAYADFDGGLTDLARTVAGEPTRDFVLPLDLFAAPTVTFQLLPRISQIRSALDLSPSARQELVTQGATVFLTGGQNTRSLVLFDSSRLIFLGPTMFDLPQDRQPWRDRSGKVWGTRFHMPNFSFDAAPTYKPVSASFRQQLDLIGYSIEEQVIRPGEALHVTLYWRLPHRLSKDYKIFVHLVDGNLNAAGGLDTYPLQELMTRLDFQNATLPDTLEFRTEKDLEPGRYHLEVGLYDPLTLERVPVYSEGTESDHLLLGPLKAPLSQPLAMPHLLLNYRLGDGIRLLGYSPDPLQLRRGESLALTLFWESLRDLERDYSVFVHFQGPTGTIVAQSDHDPVRGSYPTSIWSAGERIMDTTELNIPSSLAAGEYSLKLGMYERGSGARLPVFDARGERLPEDLITVSIGNLE